MPLEAVAELRASVYGLLGELFLRPTEQRFDRIVQEAGRVQESPRLGQGFPFEPSLRSLLRELTSATEDRLTSFRQDYRKLLTPSGGDTVCLPYESRLVGDREAQGAVAADVERAYAESGLAISGAATVELPDHVGLELQFLCLLCVEEASCWSSEDRVEAHAWLRRQQAFLRAHVARFVPALTRCVRRRAPEDSLVRELVEVSHAFVVHDADLVATLLGIDAEEDS